MAFNLGDILGGIVREEAKKATPVVRTPRQPAPVYSPPPPPVLSPVPSRNIGASIGQAVQQAAASPSIMPAPPRLQVPSFSIGQMAQREIPTTQGITGLSVGSPVAMPFASNVGQNAIRTTREASTQEWGVYDVDGISVAMPSFIATENNLPMVSARTTTDAEEVSRLQSNQISYRNMPEEVTSKLSLLPDSDLGKEVAKEARALKKNEQGRNQFEVAKEREQFATDITATTLAKAAELKSMPSPAPRVTEIDGKAYPVGTAEPTTVSLNPGMVSNDPIPAAPYGYVWVTEERPPMFSGDLAANIWLVPLRLDDEGKMIIPPGMASLRADEGPPGLLNIANLLTPTGNVVGNAAGKGLEYLVRGVTAIDEVGANILPQDVKDLWDKYIQEPWTEIVNNPDLDVALEETIGEIPLIGPIIVDIWQRPELKEAVTVALETPATGSLLALGAPQRILVNTSLEQQIDAMRGGDGPDGVMETAGLGVYSVLKHIPVVGDVHVWVEENPDAAFNLYDNGYDQNKDGTMDYYGADAVYNYYMDTEVPSTGVGILYRLTIETVTDPLTWIPLVGLAGKVVRRGGKTLRMKPTATPARVATGRALEQFGRGVEVSARALEDVSDLGARYVLQAGGAIFKRTLGKETATAKVRGAQDDAEQAVTDALQNKVSPMSRNGRGVIVPGEDGVGYTIEMSGANRRTTGRAVTKTVARSDEVAKSIDAAEAFPVGSEIEIPSGTYVWDGNDWVLDKPGQPQQKLSSTAAVQGDIAKDGSRWDQWPIEQGRNPRYIDPIKASDYQAIRAIAGDTQEATVQRMREVDTPKSDVPNPQHLKYSNVAAWATMDATNQINPTYAGTAVWERNWNGGDTNYQLSESFQRASWPVAAKYWDAMTGGGSTVPLHLGNMYSGTSPRFRLDKVPEQFKNASVQARRIRMANDTVDAVYARLKFHPDDINIPAFRQIVKQAAELDYDLRVRELRDNHSLDYGPITDLIPDGTINLDSNVRNMSRYTGTQEIPDAELPGEPVGTVALDTTGDIVADMYLVAAEQVPAGWAEYWRVNDDLFDPDRAIWVEAQVRHVDGSGFTVYGNSVGHARLVAQETAAARGMANVGNMTNEWLPGEPISPVDHVAAAEAADAPVVPNMVQPAWSPSPKLSTTDAADFYPAMAERYNLATPQGWADYLTAIGVTGKTNKPRQYMRTAVSKNGNLVDVSPGGKPIRYEVKPGDTVESESFNIYVGDKKIHTNVTTPSGSHQFYSGDTNMGSQNFPDIVAAIDAMDAPAPPDVVPPASEPTPTASVAPEGTQSLTEAQSPFAQIRQLLDSLEGIQPVEAVSSMIDDTPAARSPIEIVQPEVTRAVTRVNNTARYHGHLPEGLELPELTGTTRSDPTGTVEIPVRQAVEAEAAEAPTASPVAQKMYDDVLAMDENSPAFRAVEARHSGQSVTTHKVQRSGDAVQVSDAEDYSMLGHPLTKAQNDILTAHPFPDGETLKDRITRYFQEEFKRNGGRNSFDWYEDRATKKAFAEYEAHLIENVHPDLKARIGKKVRFDKWPPVIRLPLEGVAWVAKKILAPYDHLTRYYRERMLFNWTKVLHYPSVQYFGNMQLAVLSGDMRAIAHMLNLKNPARGFQSVKAVQPEFPWRQATPITYAQKMNAKLGIASAPETTDVFRGLQAGETGDLLIGQATLQKLPGGKVLSKAAGTRWGKEVGAGMDVMWRDVIEGTTTTTNMKHTFLPDFRNQTINRMTDWGMGQAEAIRLWDEFWSSLGPREWAFSYNDIVAHYSPHVGRGRAERLGRDWNATLNKNKQLVRAEIRRRGFAQPQTIADLFGQRFLAFHFFQSRQMWFMWNQMARHPFLINLYQNANMELNEMAERNDWPPYLRGFVRMMGMPGGRSLYMNPTALMQTWTMFRQENTMRYDQEGEHKNQVEGWIKKWTGFDVDLQDVGINPVLDKIVNVTGMAGDSWSPDLLQVGRESDIITLAINTARYYGLIGDDPRPIGNLNTDINSKIREKISDLNPISDTVEARSSEQSMDREIRAVMVDELERQGIDPESPEGQRILNEAEMDPDSDLYQRSLKRWIAGEWFEQATKFAIGPSRPRTRIDNVDGKDLMTNLAENSKKFVNTPEPMVGMFRQQQSGFYDIGTPVTRQTATLWSSIVYGDVRGDITINGITYTEAEIEAMTVDQRKAVANGMLAERGALDDVHQLWDDRDKFLAQPENRDYAQYETWQNAVRDYEGGAEQYWKDLIRDNPTAEAYYNANIKDESDPAIRSRLMTNNAAFFSIVGWDSYVFDKPVEAYGSKTDIWDPVGIANTQAQPIPYEEAGNPEFNTEIRELPVLQYDLQQWDTAFRDKLPAYGYDRNADIPSLPTKVRVGIEDELKAEGISEPSPSWQQEIYLEWVATQPPGADVSPEAFMVANQQAYYDRLPQETDAAINAPAPIPGPDKYGNTRPAAEPTGDMWMTIFNLINQHDHTRKKEPLYRP